MPAVFGRRRHHSVAEIAFDLPLTRLGNATGLRQSAQMAAILSISSQVVRGHVGKNSALVPGLAALGHEVWPLPTIVLSNHPGHGASEGRVIEGREIDTMVEALEEHGWLCECAGVMSGYFRNAEQVAAASRAVNAVKRANPKALYCCDPVLGDDPGGLYVPQEVAVAVRDQLVPQADLVTPNRFELEWLAGTGAGGRGEAIAAARLLRAPSVMATSVNDHVARANVLVSANTAAACPFQPLDVVPHGVGDLFAGLAFASLLDGRSGAEALSLATARIGHVIAMSKGRDELDLVHGLAGLEGIAPAACETVPAP